MDAAELTWLDVGLRLGAAVLFGLVVGFEREVDGHDAGARTHMLLSLGAALFGAMSVGAFTSFLGAEGGVQFDPSRIASYVVAGVGFLCGGTILKTEQRVRGLTTAASLWAVAAVGLASGLGFWSAAVLGTILALLILLVERPLRSLARRITPRTPTDS